MYGLLHDNKFNVEIAGITVGIVCNYSGPKMSVCGERDQFMVDAIEPHVSILAAWGIPYDRILGEKLFDAGDLWQLYQNNGSFLFCFTAPTAASEPYKVAFFDSDFTSGEVYLGRPFSDHRQRMDILEYPLDELLVMNLLARGRGVEIHACGIVDSLGNGHLFVGQSGAGKTTMAKMWKGVEGVKVLSDDRIILRKQHSRVLMYGTPWHGEAGFASPDCAPLKRIYQLQHGQKNKLVANKGVSAAAGLFSCSFVPFYSPEGLDFTLGFLEEVVKTTPCYDFRVAPGDGVVEFIQKFKD